MATLVQFASNTTTGAASVAVGSTQGWAAPAAGNLLVAWANADVTITTPTGFTAGPSVVDNNGVYFWYKAVAAGTETSVSFPFGASTSPGTVGLMEYSGLAATPFDVQNSSTIASTAGTTTTAVSVTGTGTSGDLVIAIAGLHATTATFPTSPVWTNSFVNRQGPVNAGAVNSGTACCSFVGDFQSSAAGAVSTACSWTNSINDRQELVIAFKLAAGAAPAAAPPLATYIGPG